MGPKFHTLSGSINQYVQNRLVFSSRRRPRRRPRRREHNLLSQVGGRKPQRYLIITQSLLLRPNTSGEYISSALVGGTTNVPGVVARAI